MILSIMQPAYLAWLGYYDRIMKSDLHVILDHVQMEKGGFTNRNRIRTKTGSAWLTVPVKKTGSLQDLQINKVECDNNQKWARKHMAGLQTWYGKAPFFKHYRDEISAIYENSPERLVDITDAFEKLLLSFLDIDTPMIKSSQMKVTSTKSQLVLDICLEAGASKYLSGPFGREYLDLETFSDAGIEVLWHDYDHPEYQQAYEGFEPYMSAIDVLFNHGPAARDIIFQDTH